LKDTVERIQVRWFWVLRAGEILVCVSWNYHYHVTYNRCPHQYAEVILRLQVRSNTGIVQISIDRRRPDAEVGLESQLQISP
jgi:nitrite reductase/ring-hydroxylating ferredoxin subunit